MIFILLTMMSSASQIFITTIGFEHLRKEIEKLTLNNTYTLFDRYFYSDGFSITFIVGSGKVDCLYNYCERVKISGFKSTDTAGAVVDKLSKKIGFSF